MENMEGLSAAGLDIETEENIENHQMKCPAANGYCHEASEPREGVKIQI